MTDLRFESFTVSGEPGTIDDKGREFVRALDYGFLENSRSDDLVIAQLDRFRAENVTLTAVYDDGQDARSLGAERPVATFGDFRGTVCVRPGQLVPAQMVTEVTVRGTHRRRGILSQLMTDALRRAADEGLALSLLTASEGGIYGRFGFGAAAFSQRISLKAHHGLRLREDVRSALGGLRVIVPTWDAFARAYDEFYPTFQAATVGQVGNTRAFRQRAAGDTNAWALHGVRKDLRPMLALNDADEVVGYALADADYETHSLTVSDLGAATPLAELALWDALAATDLVSTVHWNEAPLDTALVWALIDARDVDFGARHDHLWARVLNLPAAFAARGLAAEGTLSLTVTDRHGFVDGTWTITRSADATTATRGEAGEAHLETDAETLGSLLLGTVSVQTLVALGRARVTGLAEVSRLLAGDVAPRNSYTF